MATDNTRRSRYSFPARHHAAVDLFRRCYNWRTCSAHDQRLTWRLSPGCKLLCRGFAGARGRNYQLQFTTNSS